MILLFLILASEGEQGIETLESNPVWQSNPAVENGNVYLLNDPSNWTNKGLIASQKTIDDVEYVSKIAYTLQSSSQDG